MTNTNKPYKRPVSVLVVIHHQHRQFLMLQRVDKPEFWQSVTGSLEADENPIEAAVRELCEETGLCLAKEQVHDWQLYYDYDIYPEYWYRYPPGTRRNTEHVFSVNVALDSPIVIAPAEHSAYRWVDANSALAMAYSPSNRNAIEQLILQAAS